jgi:hypothetical protein
MQYLCISTQGIKDNGICPLLEAVLNRVVNRSDSECEIKVRLQKVQSEPQLCFRVRVSTQKQHNGFSEVESSETSETVGSNLAYHGVCGAYNISFSSS